MKKKILLAAILIVICLNQTTSAVCASGESIVGDYFNKVFDVKLTNGKTLVETPEDAQEREQINNNINDGTETITYSLYDRFGGQIKFVPYFGETRISVGIADFFYSKYLKDESFTLSKDEIMDLLNMVAISNNVVYDDRQDILSTEELESGFIDPRVYAYNAVSTNGGEAALGNSMLGVSNFFTTLTGWLSGGSLYNSINDIWAQIMNSGVQDIMQTIAAVVIPLAICVAIIVLVLKMFKIIKGEESGKKVFLNLLSMCVSLGVVFTLLANPTIVAATITKVVTLFDSVLDSTLIINSNEVVKSDSTKNVRIAMLWEQTVFEPWCQGMFGQEYSKLYTQYDTNPDHIKMAQSKDDVINTWTDGSIKYNSAAITGDINVPIGLNITVKNWAALAWSTQSIYHIDAVNGELASANVETWPKAARTPMNDNIYIDSFRWIDAQLNISPEYHSADEVVQNFSASNNYKQSFVASGAHSLYLSLLLIPILILAIRKLICSVKIVSSGIELCYCSVLNFIMPDRYDILSNLKKVGKNIYDLFWWSIVIFLAISIYSSMINISLIGDFVWLLVGIYLIKFKPIRTSDQVRKITNGIKKGATKVVGAIKNRRGGKTSS